MYLPPTPHPVEVLRCALVQVTGTNAHQQYSFRLDRKPDKVSPEHLEKLSKAQFFEIPKEVSHWGKGRINKMVTINTVDTPSPKPLSPIGFSRFPPVNNDHPLLSDTFRRRRKLHYPHSVDGVFVYAIAQSLNREPKICHL